MQEKKPRTQNVSGLFMYMECSNKGAIATFTATVARATDFTEQKNKIKKNEKM